MAKHCQDANPNDYVFKADRRNAAPHISVRSIQRYLADILTELGLKTAQLCGHVFRHTWATLAIEKKVPLDVVQKQLRHASLTTTIQCYSHRSRENRRKELDDKLKM
jgi:integrase